MKIQLILTDGPSKQILSERSFYDKEDALIHAYLEQREIAPDQFVRVVARENPNGQRRFVVQVYVYDHGRKAG